MVLGRAQCIPQAPLDELELDCPRHMHMQMEIRVPMNGIGINLYENKAVYCCIVGDS